MLRHYRVPRPRFPLRRKNLADSATNKGYIAYFSLCMREMAVFPLPVKNLTEKSDVAIVLLDPDFF